MLQFGMFFYQGLIPLFSQAGPDDGLVDRSAREEPIRCRTRWMTSLGPFLAWCLLLIWLAGCQNRTGNVLSSKAETAGQPSGALIFIELDEGDQFISRYDIEANQITRIFAAPENGWISQIDVLNDNSRLVMAYAAPPPAGEIQFGYTELYQMPLDETAVPTLLLGRQNADDSLFNPVWSPDGQYIYFTEVAPDPTDATKFTVALKRHKVNAAEVETIFRDGIWPRLSAEGKKLVVVSVDPFSLGNSLWLLDADGSNPQQLIEPDQFRVIDVPMFSPDGRWVYFTAAEKQSTAVRWWEALSGIRPAAAHDIPSDWYRISMEGGQPERLTMVNEVGIYGDFSPDGQSIAFATYNGLYIMQINGSNLEKIVEIGSTSTLSWIR